MQVEVSKITEKELPNEKLERAESTKEKLERVVAKTINITDNTTDYLTIKKVTQKVIEKLINHRNTYDKEASGSDKKMFFLESRYEIERENQLREYLCQKIPIKTTGDQIVFERELKRLSHIDSRLAKGKDEIYFTPIGKQELMEQYAQGSHNIALLTKEYKKRGFNHIESNFIATEIIQYQEKYGRNISLKQEEYIGQISNYVDKNYNDLIKFGLDKKEAMISYNEGERFVSKYDRNIHDGQITKTDVINAQKESKLEFERGQNIVSSSNVNTNASSKSSNKTTVVKDVSFEL
jgi:hypothetical protein